MAVGEQIVASLYHKKIFNNKKKWSTETTWTIIKKIVMCKMSNMIDELWSWDMNYDCMTSDKDRKVADIKSKIMGILRVGEWDCRRKYSEFKEPITVVMVIK